MVNFKGLKRWIAWVSRGRKAEITFFEVKELYNLAYEQKAQARIALRQYRRIEVQARAMDAAYRTQLKLTTRAAW